MKYQICELWSFQIFKTSDEYMVLFFFKFVPVRQF